MSTDDGVPSGEGGDGREDAGPPGVPGLSGLGPMGPLSGFGDLFGQARDQVEQASFEAANVKVTGRAGGGAVEIELTGNLDAVSVKIAREVVDPDDVGMLEDLLLAALRHVLAEAVEVREQAASTLLPPGLDLGAMMSGLFGPGGVGGDTPEGGGASPGSGAFGGLTGLASGGTMPPLEGLIGQLFGGEFSLFGQDAESDDDDDDDNDNDNDDNDADDDDESRGSQDGELT